MSLLWCWYFRFVAYTTKICDQSVFCITTAFWTLLETSGIQQIMIRNLWENSEVLMMVGYLLPASYQQTKWENISTNLVVMRTHANITASHYFQLCGGSHDYLPFIV